MCAPLLFATGLIALFLATASWSRAAEVIVKIETPMEPPKWAVLERQLLSENVPACREFFRRYFDDRGYLQCFVRWGANDGPDDAFENFNRWPELHALGASDEILQMYLKGWEGLLKQVHGSKDGRRANRSGRHVLQGFLCPSGLDAFGRRVAPLQSHGSFGADRRKISGASAP